MRNCRRVWSWTCRTGIRTQIRYCGLHNDDDDRGDSSSLAKRCAEAQWHESSHQCLLSVWAALTSQVSWCFPAPHMQHKLSDAAASTVVAPTLWKYFPLHEAPSLSCPSVLTEIFSYSAVVQPLQLYCGLWPVFVSLYVFKSNSLLPKRCTSVIRLLLLTDQTCIHH